MPTFQCDLADPSVPLRHAWEHTIGSGHAPLALRGDWQCQLARCHRELGVRYVRFHGLLSDDVGTVTRQKDELLYSFFNADKIIEALLSIGVKPFVELSFMPEALASGDKTVFSYKGNVTPPSDHKEWGELIKRLASHWVARYGIDEVRQWYFEVWNEPNISDFWAGDQADYFELYRVAAEAIKDVDASVRVGGPATAKNAWIEEFLDFCDRRHVPADFVSTHHYPTDALGGEGTDSEAQLAAGRRGLLREQAQDAVRRAAGRPLHYTEWNVTSNPRDPLHDQPFAAAFVAKSMLDVDPLVEAYSYWTFTDIFEENYFPSKAFHGGFGLLTLAGIAKPSYRAVELLHGLGWERMHVDGLHETVDATVTRGGDGLQLLFTNHALPRHDIRRERVELSLSGVGRPDAVSVRRVDEHHANAHRAWQEMGSPAYPTPAQEEELHAASELSDEPLEFKFDDGILRLALDLPPHAVAAVTIQVGDDDSEAEAEGGRA